MKDAYYFPHDSNAKDDPKIINMIEQHGPEAYGIYWILIETLRDQPEFRAPVNILPGLARRYNTTFDKMKSVVITYGLFEVSDDEYFFSLSLNRRMDAINEKRKKLSEAGRKGNLKRWNDKELIATLSPGDRHPIASKGKESKEKEIKENYLYPKSINDPDLLMFFNNNGSTNDEAIKFFAHYNSQNWHKSNNMPISNWESAAINWINKAKHDHSIGKRNTGYKQLSEDEEEKLRLEAYQKYYGQS
jgi:hypothetical protein